MTEPRTRTIATPSSLDTDVELGDRSARADADLWTMLADFGATKDEHAALHAAIARVRVLSFEQGMRAARRLDAERLEAASYASSTEAAVRQAAELEAPELPPGSSFDAGAGFYVMDPFSPMGKRKVAGPFSTRAEAAQDASERNIAGDLDIVRFDGPGRPPQIV